MKIESENEGIHATHTIDDDDDVNNMVYTTALDMDMDIHRDRRDGIPISRLR